MGRSRGNLVKLLVLLLLAASLAAVTPARGGGPTYVHTVASGEWTIEGSPYIVIEDTEVPEAAGLVVHAGVEVRFGDGVRLTAFGPLTALGADAAPVLFTSNKTVPFPGAWWGLVLAVSEGHSLVNTVVEYATTGVSVEPWAHAAVQDSEVRMCAQSGFNVHMGGLSLERVTVHDCLNGVSALESEVDVFGSRFEWNSEAGLRSTGSAVRVSESLFLWNGVGAALQSSTMFLNRSTIDHSVGGALALSLISEVDAFGSTVLGELTFGDLESVVREHWTLTVRVEDLYGTALPNAHVHIVDNANGTYDGLFTAGAGGKTEPIPLLARYFSMDGAVELGPFAIHATFGEGFGNAEALLAGDELVAVTVGVDKTPPKVKFGAPAVTADEDTAVTLDGTSTHDGDPQFPLGAAFEWTFLDGHDIVLYGQVVSHTFSTPGEYDVTLAATDAAGNTGTGTLFLTIRDVTPPTADAGEDALVHSGEVWTLDASATADNDPDFPRGAQFVWTFVDGGTATLYGVRPAYEFGRAGTYTITLTVEDAAGNVGTDQVVVTVKAEEAFPWVPVIAVGGALFAAAAISSTEAGKFGLLKLLFVPLYVKLRKKDVLDHFIRGQIYGYVRVHPGDTYTDVKENLGLKNGTLTYHLDVLLREGLIKSRTSGANKLFYPAGSRMPEDGAALHAVQKMILERVGESPGISAADLAGLIGVSRQLVNYHVKDLVANDLVRIERTGMRNRFYPP